jgi:cyclase
LIKRIIPCLDIKAGRVVKGVQFADLNDAGDPVELAGYYNQHGADELVFLDITATNEGRKTMLDVAAKVAREVSIPLIVGGGIDSIEQMDKVLQTGADKFSFNTPAVENPGLIEEAARIFGSRCVIVAIDARWNEKKGDWEVYTHGGRQVAGGLTAVEWAARVENLGAGEILLTSMDADGGRDGFDIPLTRAVSEKVGIPVIASGGAGKMEDFYKVLTAGKAAAALAASVFHYRLLSITDLKKYLLEQGLEVHLSDDCQL